LIAIFGDELPTSYAKLTLDRTLSHFFARYLNDVRLFRWPAGCDLRSVSVAYVPQTTVAALVRKDQGSQLLGRFLGVLVGLAGVPIGPLPLAPLLVSVFDPIRQ
jgi:hypothetical protein